MAVAEKTTASSPASQDPRQRLMIHSAVGAAFVLASLWFVFMGYPTLWRIVGLGAVSNEYLADSLQVLLLVPIIFGLFLLGRALEGPSPVPGARAGAFVLSFLVIVFGLLVTSGVPLLSVIGLLALGGLVILLFQPAFLEWLKMCEGQGWFHASAFKANQGLRVRRSTVIAIMIVVIFGIITMIQQGSLRTKTWWIIPPLRGGEMIAATNPWIVSVPFGEESLVFMYYITLTIPVLLLVGSMWFSWRLVNWPTFADFLIATEAEMNKVSWTSRNRLHQDTIVVLAAVFIMTAFLFVVDILWIKILTNPFIDVLKHDTKEAVLKNQSRAQW